MVMPPNIRAHKKDQPERAGIVFDRAEKSRHTFGMYGLVTQIDTPGFKLLIDSRNVTAFIWFDLFFHRYIPDIQIA